MKPTLTATISSSSKTAGIWIDADLFEVLKKNGARPKDEYTASLLVHVTRVDSEGILIDTMAGNLVLEENLQDIEHPERFARGRFNKEFSYALTAHRGYFNPTVVEARIVDYGKILIDLPDIVDRDTGEPINEASMRKARARKQ